MQGQELPISVEVAVDSFREIIVRGYHGIQNSIVQKDEENVFFDFAIEKYITGLLERNSTIKVLTMREPQALQNLYVRANILKDKITSEEGLTAEELEIFFQRDGRSFGNTRETVDGELMVNKLQKFIVLGKPGAGKTTYLRYLTLMMLNPKSQIERRKLPIFVTLREWADKKNSLSEFIIDQFRVCGFEQPDLFVENLLKIGDCLLLFDGLDEVNQETNQSGVIQQIKDISDRYRKNQFIVSCRVAAYNRWFEQFTDVEMADFNEKQIEQFIINWFHSEGVIGRECWNKLNRYPQLKELASVPLLLTLLCITYNRSNDFPPNRANLYEEAIDALLRDWDASRRITRDVVYQQLSMSRKKSMFSRIAWGTFTESIYFIPERTLCKQIEKFIEHLPGFKPEEIDVDSHAILKSIEAQHGIFVERAKRVHSFAHLTFQEYFTAKYIVDTAHSFDDKGKNSIENLVENHLYDNRWKEVFLLVSAMLDNANELLLLMCQKNKKILTFPTVNEMLLYAEAATSDNENKFPLILRKIFAIFIAIVLNLERDFSHDRSLVSASARDYCLEFAQSLSQYLIFNATVPGQQNLTFHADLSIALVVSEDLSNALTGARNTTSNLIKTRTRALELAHIFNLDFSQIEAYEQIDSMSIDHAQSISKYLKGYIQVIRCLESDAFVSKHIREKIMEEMLMPQPKE